MLTDNGHMFGQKNGDKKRKREISPSSRKEICNELVAN